MVPTATPNAVADEFGLQMDSGDALLEVPMACESAHNSMTLGTLEMVARESYQQHYPLLTIPLNDVYLDPRV